MEASTIPVIDHLAPPMPGVGTTESTAPTGHRLAIVVRVVAHVAAELPILVLGIVELARGWRPLFDNADLALRSYQVFSSRSPLVGHEMAVSAGSHAVFGPGPLQNWLLAIPVRIDPAQGVLWGSLVAVVVAVALTIEAAWAVGGWRGAAVASGCVLVLALARTEVVLDVAWNVWFGLIFLVAAVGTGLAVGTGRLRWWPVTVVAASVVVQCQAGFAPPAVAVCLLAPVLGILARRRQGAGVGMVPLVVGVVVGAVVWAPPIVQQLTSRPGNLTLLARAARDSGHVIGVTAALRALGGATEVPPNWVHVLPPPGPPLFFAIVRLFNGPAWWGVAVLVLLAAIGVVAWRTSRNTLATTALLSLALTAGSVVAIASVPSSQFLDVGYLGALWIVVGISVWVTFLWAAGELVVAVAARRAGHTHSIHGRRGIGRLGVWVAVIAVSLVALSAAVVSSGLGRMDGIIPTLVGWPAVRATDAATTAVVAVAPRGPFRLQVAGPGSAENLAVETGVAYLLITRGLDPKPDSPIAYATFGRPPDHGPTVVLTLPQGGGPAGARLVSG